MILLDTHVLVWLLEGDRRLGSSARERLRAKTGPLHVSAMTFWEIGMLLSKNQIVLAIPLVNLLDSVIHDWSMMIVPVSAAIAIDAHTLPRLHGDPMDRLLIATARHLDFPLMTGDHVIEEYASAGHVKIIDARR